MELFLDKKEPIVMKESSSANQQVAALEELLLRATADLKPQIEQDIKLLSYGIYGENQILFELKNSHMPMCILHDLYLEYEGLNAQIDFLVITEKLTLVIECKNLIGNIEINRNGDFIRTLNFGKAYKKEGIYSPITQNRRHMELIKQIRKSEASHFLKKILFDSIFSTSYQGIVVLANPKTVLNDKYAKKEIREQVIRVDRLVEYIRQVNTKSKNASSSLKQMVDLAAFFLSIHKENAIDYQEKYKKIVSTETQVEEPVSHIVSSPQPKIIDQEKTFSVDTQNPPVCPKCNTPMILRTATKGERLGKQFWGCSNYPKCRKVINLDES